MRRRRDPNPDRSLNGTRQALTRQGSCLRLSNQAPEERCKKFDEIKARNVTLNEEFSKVSDDLDKETAERQALVQELAKVKARNVQLERDNG